MKKFILSLMAFSSFLTMSLGYEANIKLGYDGFRATHQDFFEPGFVLGVEVLPLTFKDSKIKLGAGVEYNFGTVNLNFGKDFDGSGNKRTFIPLYGTAKFTYYRNEKKDLNLYTFGRAGYVFSEEIDKDDNSRTPKNGVYYGLGFGLDYKYLLAEILYDGSYTTDVIVQVAHNPGGVVFNNFMHKVGVRLGLQLGSQHFKKPQVKMAMDCPDCDKQVIEKIVEVPKIIEVEKIVEVPKIVEVEKIVEKIIEVEKKPEVKKPVAKKKVVKKKAVKRKAKNTNKKSDSIRVCRWVTIYKK